MPRMSFPMNEIKRLAEHTRESMQHNPTLAQKHDPSFWSPEYAGKALTQDEVYRLRGQQVDKYLVPPGFWLVKENEGIYLMSNGSPHDLDAPDSETAHVVYAKGSSANKGGRADGGDNFIEFIPLSWYDDCEDASKSKMTIHKNRQELSLVL